MNRKEMKVTNVTEMIIDTLRVRLLHVSERMKRKRISGSP